MKISFRQALRFGFVDSLKYWAITYPAVVSVGVVWLFGLVAGMLFLIETSWLVKMIHLAAEPDSQQKIVEHAQLLVSGDMRWWFGARLFAVIIWTISLSVWVKLVTVRIALDLREKGGSSMRRLIDVIPQIFTVIGSYMLYGCMVLPLVLIIAALAIYSYMEIAGLATVIAVWLGILVMVRTGLFCYPMFLEARGSFASLKRSWQVTVGSFWRLVVLWMLGSFITTFIINLLNAIPYNGLAVVSMLLCAPLLIMGYYCMEADAYCQLQERWMPVSRD